VLGSAGLLIYAFVIAKSLSQLAFGGHHWLNAGT
jgi:hypothetical protein